MSWETTATATTSATPQQIWALWVDVSRWNRWDHEVMSSSLDGEFVNGATGMLKPHGGPTAKFVMTEVTPLVSFSDRSRLPLATLDFHHSVAVVQGVTTIKHRVVMTELLTPLFSRIIGRKIARGLPVAVNALAALAETEK